MGPYRLLESVKNLTSHELNMTAMLTITGGLLHRITASPSEQVTLPSGGEATVFCQQCVGLGPIHVTVTANGITSTYETGGSCFS